MKKLSIGLDSTLENWINMSSATFGEDSAATQFLVEKASNSTNGIHEEVIADEGQLLMVLMQLHSKGLVQ